jgi:PAS domain S-box-containing protein
VLTFQSDQKYYLSEINQEEFIQELTPLGENLVYSSALSLNYEAAFMVLLIEKQIKLVGSYGLKPEEFQTIENVPTWLLPTQVQLITCATQLKEITVITGQQALKNSLGISIIMPQGIVGALWYLNSVELNQEVSARQSQLLKVFAHQASLGIKRQLELFEMQQPHKIARERDFALSMINSIPVNIAVLDRHHQFIFVNSHLTQHLGYRVSDFQQMKPLEHIPEEDHKIIEASFVELDKGKVSIYRSRVFRKDKSLANIEVTALPMFDHLGKLIGSVATIHDITEEIALEQATLEARRAINKKLKDTLIETQRSLETEKNFAFEIMESLQDGFALLSTEGKFEYVNPAFTALGGHSDRPFIGLDAMQFAHPEDLAMVSQKLGQLKLGQKEPFELRVVRRDGKHLHILAHASLRLDANGQRSGVLISARDITDKVVDEQRLADSERESQYQRDMALTIVQTAQEGFVILKGEIIEFVNRQFETIIGALSENLIGRNIYDFIHPDDFYLSHQATQTIAEGKSSRYKQRIIRPSGQERTVVINASPRRSASGRIFGLVCSIRDLAEELESQAKVAKLEQQIENAQQKLEHGQGFAGRLEDVGGTVGLLQMVAASPVNGAIWFDDAQLFLLGGRVVAVVHPSLLGIEAVAKLVQRQHGPFQFIANLRPEKTMFNLDPVKLALEFLTKQDELTAPTQQHVVTVPNSLAAKAFIGGVGGIQHFRVSLEQNQVVLHGRGLKVIVLEAQVSEFLGQIDLDRQDTSPL